MNIAVLIVTHDQIESLRTLIGSLENQTSRDFSVYIVDNDSRPELKRYLNGLSSGYTIVHLKENIGYAAANNIGIKRAMEKDFDHFLILNPDIELKTDMVSEMSRFIEEEVGIISPLILYGGSKRSENRIHMYGVKADFNKNKTHFLWKDMKKDCIELPLREDVNMFSGAAFLLNKKAVKKAGFFDESFYMYGEEVDYARRIIAEGFKIVAVSKAVVWHHHDWTKKNKSQHCLQYYYSTRNRMLYFKKYRLWWPLVKDIAYNIISFPAKARWAIRFAGLALIKYYYLGMVMGMAEEHGESKIKIGCG